MTKTALQIRKASRRNTWDNLGEQVAKKLGYKPEEGNNFLQLCLILQKLGGFLLPIPAIQRMTTGRKWLNIEGPKKFTLCYDPSNPYITQEAEIARAIYYYTYASKLGEKPLTADNQVGEEFRRAELFTDGFLVPTRLIDKDPAGNACLIVNTARNCGTGNHIAESRCRALGLLDLKKSARKGKKK